MSRRTRRGFTLIELLVVIAIIGTLVAMLLPAVQMAREAARGNTCRNNQHNMSIAIANYVTSKRLYPGYRDSLFTPPSALGSGSGAPVVSKYPVSWQVMLLPFMEQRPLADLWKANPLNASKPLLEVFLCPSDTSTQLEQTAPNSYVVNTGQTDAPTGGSPNPDWPGNGMFLSRWEFAGGGVVDATSLPKMTDDLVRDGKSNTFLLSESIDAKTWVDEMSNGSNGYGGATTASGGPDSPTTVTPELYSGFVWWAITGTTGPGSLKSLGPNGYLSISINGPNSDTGYATDMCYARPSSSHPGVVNMAYADGRVATLNENIDYDVYCALMTPDATKCNPPGQAFIPTSSMSSGSAYLLFRKQTVSASAVQ